MNELIQDLVSTLTKDTNRLMHNLICNFMKGRKETTNVVYRLSEELPMTPKTPDRITDLVARTGFIDMCIIKVRDNRSIAAWRRPSANKPEQLSCKFMNAAECKFLIMASLKPDDPYFGSVFLPDTYLSDSEIDEVVTKAIFDAYIADINKSEIAAIETQQAIFEERNDDTSDSVVVRITEDIAGLHDLCKWKQLTVPDWIYGEVLEDTSTYKVAEWLQMRKILKELKR